LKAGYTVEDIERLVQEEFARSREAATLAGLKPE
jgi:hypothetical protein